MFLIIVYLAAIVAANLTVALAQAFAPDMLNVVTWFNSAALIAFDLTTRDTLHERWQGHVWRNMAQLIFAGSTLSAFTVILFNVLFGLELSVSAPTASFVAFALTGIADTFIYQLLHAYPRWIKMNGSNLVSAAVDSLIFPILAFVVLTPIMPIEVALGISWGQFVIKFASGLGWSVLLNWRITRQIRIATP